MLPCSGWPACVWKTPARTQQNRHTGHSGNIRHSSWPPSKCPSELALTQGVIPSRIHCLVGKPAVGAAPHLAAGQVQRVGGARRHCNRAGGKGAATRVS